LESDQKTRFYIWVGGIATVVMILIGLSAFCCRRWRKTIEILHQTHTKM